MNLEKYKQVIRSDFRENAELLDRVIKDLTIPKKGKILDVGTGFGAMAILLALNGYEVLTGQPEGDPMMEEHTHQHREQHHDFDGMNRDWKVNARAVGVEKKIKFMHFNAEHMPFKDRQFDAVFMYDVLQHVERRETAINECIRVMKERGVTVIIEWNQKSVETNKHMVDLDYINAREILQRSDVSIQTTEGEWVNVFAIRRNK